MMGILRLFRIAVGIREEKRRTGDAEDLLHAETGGFVDQQTDRFCLKLFFLRLDGFPVSPDADHPHSGEIRYFGPGAQRGIVSVCQLFCGFGIGGSGCVAGSGIVADSPSRGVCRMTDGRMKNGKIAEGGNCFSVVKDLRMERTVAFRAEFERAFMTEGVPAETDGKFPADRFIVIGDERERDDLFLFLRIQQGVDFQLDRISFEIGSPVPVGDDGGLLKRRIGTVGKADFEVVKTDAPLKRGPVVADHVQADLIVVVPADDFELPGDMLPLRGRFDPEPFQDGIADMIPARQRFHSPVAESPEIKRDIEFPHLLRRAFEVERDLHFRIPVNPEPVATKNQMKESFCVRRLQREAVFPRNGRGLNQSRRIFAYGIRLNPVDQHGPSGNRLSRIAEIHGAADVHRGCQSRKSGKQKKEKRLAIHHENPLFQNVNHR